MSLKIVPITLADANGLVSKHHRHHKRVVGHKFSLGCEMDGALVGAVIVGHPVARKTDQVATCEVTRLVTDGTKNACSMLYQGAARVAREMGYKRIQTFILTSEPGTSLKASGWMCEGEAGGGQWDHTGIKQLVLGQTHGNRTDQPTEAKQRWSRAL